MAIAEIPHIADLISQGQAIAFIGAGASMTAKDPYTKKEILGLPSANQLVQLMKKNRDYITDGLSFSDACFLLQNRENSLVKFLSSHLNKNIEPLPTHKLLASLPIETFISMNFDGLLEKALEKEGKKFRRILKESDVSLLQNDEIPVIKPHGCFTQEKDIIASTEDEIPFQQRFPLVDCFLKTKLANKTLIFIGFGLHDKDFEQSLQQLQQSLGNLAPHSYAISKDPSNFDIEYWKKKKVTILNCDAGEFLKEIKSHINIQNATDIHESERELWFDNPSFPSLRDIKNLPTETQLIDAFLDQLITEIENNEFTIHQIIKEATKARTLVFKKKSNFEAFKKAADEILSGLKLSTDHSAAETFLKEYKEKREKIAKDIQKKWSKIIQANDNILLFSQSKRVSQVLFEVSKAVQKTCSLYIAECRPKCPGHSFFQDTIETITKLGKVEYNEIIFFPDIIVGHLFESKKITKVIMGAHAVFVNKKGGIESFINTVGSLVISQLCERYKIPLFVIAEKDKEKNVSYLTNGKISTTQEVDLVDRKTRKILSDLQAQGHKIQILNFGYDLIPANVNTTYINEL
jgi:translation initiation factor 2B subunit (eIF-2B alpha/beta/delta family)